MNVLYLYNSTQTYTNTVFEHLTSFSKYSKHSSFFCHQDQSSIFNLDLSLFDAIVIHYSIRLPFNQISDSTSDALKHFSGLKALFIQDEYDGTYRTWEWIKRLDIKLVFTVTPPNSVNTLYPKEEFPFTRFVSVLTGYVPDEMADIYSATLPSERELIVGYRGRALPIRYGKLGQEKVAVGKLVKQYCDSKNIKNDIAWTEDSRLYGSEWYNFLSSCRSMLGSESGSNVLPWNDLLDIRIEDFRKSNPKVSDDEIYKHLVEPFEIPGLMNQVSPRVFEAIASRTTLVLFEGSYSGVVLPGLHYISLKKDGSNLDEVFELLSDGDYIDKMTETAYRDVVASGLYGYPAFVQMIDEQMTLSFSLLQQKASLVEHVTKVIDFKRSPIPITLSPIRHVLPISSSHGTVKNIAIYLWNNLPCGVRTFFKPRLKRFFRKN